MFQRNQGINLCHPPRRNAARNESDAETRNESALFESYQPSIPAHPSSAARVSDD
jgi:hypothetical protein